MATVARGDADALAKVCVSYICIYRCNFASCFFFIFVSFFSLSVMMIMKARGAYAARRFRGDVGWNQNAMDAALLGLAQDASQDVIARATTGNLGLW